jgi:hypothetical protein
LSTTFLSADRKRRKLRNLYIADLLVDVRVVDVQNTRSLGVFGLSPSTLAVQNSNDVLFFFQALNFLVESSGLLNNLFSFPSILDASYPAFYLHLADVLCDVILPSVLGYSL